MLNCIALIFLPPPHLFIRDFREHVALVPFSITQQTLVLYDLLLRSCFLFVSLFFFLLLSFSFCPHFNANGAKAGLLVWGLCGCLANPVCWGSFVHNDFFFNYSTFSSLFCPVGFRHPSISLLWRENRFCLLFFSCSELCVVSVTWQRFQPFNKAIALLQAIGCCCKQLNKKNECQQVGLGWVFIKLSNICGERKHTSTEVHSELCSKKFARWSVSHL